MKQINTLLLVLALLITYNTVALIVKNNDKYDIKVALKYADEDYTAGLNVKKDGQVRFIDKTTLFSKTGDTSRRAILIVGYKDAEKTKEISQVIYASEDDKEEDKNNPRIKDAKKSIDKNLDNYSTVTVSRALIDNFKISG